MDGPGGLNWTVQTTETGRSWIKLDGPKDFKRTVCESGPEPSTSTLRFIPRDRPLLVEWPSTLTHDRPLWLKRPFTIVLDRPLWLEWPSSLAQDRPLLDGPSTFAWPFTLRTVHFHPFGPFTLNQTHFGKTVVFDKIYYYCMTPKNTSDLDIKRLIWIR